MNTAVIGLGYWGPNLVRNFVKHSSVRKVYCYDVDENRVHSICKEFPAVIAASCYEQILNDLSVDAIVLSTPVASHFDLALQALEHGKHVLLEKPMTSSVKQAEQLIDIANRKSLKLMVDHIFVYNGAVQKIKQIIDSGEIGKIMYFDAVRINLGLFQHDVNVLWDLATHDLSIMRYLYTKKPRAVSAIGKGHFHQLEDIAYLTVLFENNCIAHFHVNWLAPVKVRTILIGGSQKMIVYDEMETTEKIKVYDKGVEITSREGVYKTLIGYRRGDVYVPKFDTSEPLANVVDEFIGAIQKNKTPLTDGNAGLEIVDILEAAQKSIAKNGEIVVLDEHK